MVSNANGSIEEDKQREIQENNGGHMSLAITQCIGETQANLAITNYLLCGHSKSIQRGNLGYSSNQDLNYDALAPLLHFHLNNAGDPFLGSGFSLDSTKFEVSVFDWFSNVWDIEKCEYWGCVTTNGTKGNLHGILVGREQFPNGILYTSKDSHYSIFKIARMYRIQCVTVRTLVSGEIDYVDLKASLIAHKDKLAIINLNIGTTMKGAVDKLDLVIQSLKESGFPRDRFFIHCDAALLGIMLSFLERAPMLTFKKPVGSISVSGHKFLGCPFPCGVVITRLQYVNALSRDIEIIASRDVTITGSRCGHASIFLWYALKKEKVTFLVKKKMMKCITNARYLHKRLCNAGIEAMLNEYSNMVVFERPPDEDFTRRWNLQCKGNIAHVVVMLHVTIEMLDSFVDEFIENRYIWFRGGLKKPSCIAHEIDIGNCACTLHHSNSNGGMH